MNNLHEVILNLVGIIKLPVAVSNNAHRFKVVIQQKLFLFTAQPLKLDCVKQQPLGMRIIHQLWPLEKVNKGHFLLVCFHLRESII